MRSVDRIFLAKQKAIRRADHIYLASGILVSVVIALLPVAAATF